MTTTKREKSLIVIQLSGGNDYLNTVVPYSEGKYYDYRSTVNIPQDKVIPIDDRYGFNPSMGPVKFLWDERKVAIINGIGYQNPNRSHFRSMDIWHTAEPDSIGKEGWLGRAIRDIDPLGENVLTGINFGRGLPRALACPGVSVASVGDLDTYGLFPDVQDEELRMFTLEAFSKMYGGAAGRDPVMELLGQTGQDALQGADILRTAPAMYKSSVEYGPDSLAQNVKSISQVFHANLGAKILYTQHGPFDTHSGELLSHAKLWDEVAGAIGCLMDDLKEHGTEDDASILVFSEFGRRIQDNGSGSDHGSAGVAFMIGGAVNGGMYGEYPSLAEAEQIDGDLRANNDFRSVYTGILEDWMGLDAAPIVNGQFEKFDLFKS
ncbi:MAG: hypothetical protein DSY79_11000 [Chloroflexi bacterium]|jgi:uncharacterized protein (DUF1501 family)|nr:DUF1501 domain-containing protein [Dehalococcoidia bacterium]PKB85194.1 MAG: hypothetical protein BZY86_03665 [SAR202 cluster bacterium MP-NPac-SRR3961935-G1]RUA20481.1 MAG: hypothetical protein DSY79_11000 [Chloroflexota bacterium]RUA29897.1 MAG: hypothetical protein DSY78_11245 [Chloroflexota bacterium]HIM63218.1 DUF1501 domain-containing protein [Dehalococcoidia bacterium]|tara:strand:+ start:1583 stop:2716 length:1134 start_codon:yes stop_codon:yes gene_type:complete